MLVKVGSLYLTLGTFGFNYGEALVYCEGAEIALSHENATELKHILDEIIAGQKSVEICIAEQRAQSEELQKRAEALQQREQYVEAIALQAQQIVAASQQQQQKSPMILPPGFGRKRG